MKREEKSALLRKKIVDVSRELFIEQGYTATTMRQIQEKTGLTTGSLYNFFKNKEDILKHSAADYLVETDKLIKSLMKSYDPTIHYALIIYVQMKIIDRDDRLADIWNNAYSQWGTAELICRNSATRNKTMFGEYNRDMTEDEWFSRSLVINGALHNIILEKLNRGSFPLKERFRLVMSVVLFLFNLPPDRFDASVSRAEKLFEKEKAILEIYGVSLA